MKMKFYGVMVLITLVILISLIYSIRIKHNAVINKLAYRPLSTKTPFLTRIIEYIVITETPIPTRTPTSTPFPTITPTPKLIPSQLDSIFEKYAKEFSVDKNLLKKIALCESGLNLSARNGPYGGLFQFTSSAWVSVRRAMNADTNADLRFNGEEAIKTAAFKLSTGGVGIWPNCSK